MSADRQRIETKMRSTFGLKRLPFSKDLGPDELFLTEVFTQAQDRLRYLVDRRGIGAVFGAPGTGKSTLLRAFLGGLGKAAYSVCYVSHSTCAVLDLFREIARGFAIDPRYRKADVIREVKERIVKLSRSQKMQPVLVIDDAHLLPTHVLDDLRLLTSFDADSRDDLTMVLCGHPQLEANLRLAINEAIAQRIVQRVRLRSLHPDEVDAYLRFRLELAGRSAKLFLPEASEAIARAARGVPRLVDRLAEHSMLIALRNKQTEIDTDVVTAGRAYAREHVGDRVGSQGGLQIDRPVRALAHGRGDDGAADDERDRGGEDQLDQHRTSLVRLLRTRVCELTHG